MRDISYICDMKAIQWSIEEYAAKASKGSFAARAARADVYRNNCEIFQAGAYLTESGKTVTLDPSAMLEGTVVFDAPISLPAADGTPIATRTGVANIGSIELGRDLQLKGYNPVILNLADAYVACGWYYKGSNAQEESLCRQSTLSQSLYQYYGAEQAAQSGVSFRGKRYPMDLRHGAIYSPHVTVFREGAAKGYALMDEPYETAFISCAALDFNEKHGKNREYRNSDGGFTSEGREIMRSKIRTIFGAALAGGHDAIVLGAFGCGAFRLHPDLVAALFRQVLIEPAFKDRFKVVAFAILEGKGPETGARGKFAPFYGLFGQYGSNMPAMAAPESPASCDSSRFTAGMVVSHGTFGRGTVKDVQADRGRVTVDFPGVGTKVLSIDKAKLEILDN